MKINYFLYTSLPNAGVVDEINKIHLKIFKQDDDLHAKMERKSKLLTVIAMIEDKIVGYKMGYEIDEEIFYSWLGGVDFNYRNQGIASELLNIQHDYLIKTGYKTVRTKTLNKWKEMLILNLKNGFEVKSTYADKRGQNKIILEKNLI